MQTLAGRSSKCLQRHRAHICLFRRAVSSASSLPPAPDVFSQRRCIFPVPPGDRKEESRAFVQAHPDALVRKAQVCVSPLAAMAFSRFHHQFFIATFRFYTILGVGEMQLGSRSPCASRLWRNVCQEVPRMDLKAAARRLHPAVLSHESMNKICIERALEHSDSGCDKALLASRRRSH